MVLFRGVWQDAHFSLKIALPAFAFSRSTLANGYGGGGRLSMSGFSGSWMRTLTMRGSPVADAPDASVRDEAPWLPSQLAWKRWTAQFTLLTSIGAGTGGAHAGMLAKMRSPAALGSVTAAVMPGVST